MKLVAAPLALFACLAMAGAAHGATIPVSHRSVCYGGREVPEKKPDSPQGCHAAMSCAAHRKLRIFP